MNDFDQNKQIAIIWSVEDVQSLAPHLTDEQAMDVLNNVKRKHDATMGVSWDTLEFWIRELYSMKPIKDGDDDDNDHDPFEKY